MRRYAIIGTGALGGFYGGLLAKSGADVHFLAHRDADSIREHGLLVESKWGDFHLPNVSVYSSSDTMPICDTIVVCLKTTQNDCLTDILPPLVGPKTSILVLQNGLHVEETSRTIVGPGRVMGGCCFLCSNKIGPGHIRHLDYGRISFGAYRGIDEQDTPIAASTMTAIEMDFQHAGVPITIAANLTEARWRKLMWNIPFNGLSVILNASTRELIESNVGSRLARTLMDEVRSIATAAGNTIETSFVDKLLDDTIQMVPYDSSMRLDFLAHRTMEIEAIFGNPLRSADRLGHSASQLRMVYEQLRYFNERIESINERNPQPSR